LLGKAEEQLSPEERRVVATLLYGEAMLNMFRVSGNAPPPGPAWQKLHETAVAECQGILRLLEPFVAKLPEFDDVKMSFWAASRLADYFAANGDMCHAGPNVESALSLAADAARRVLRTLYQELPTAVRKRDLQEVLITAIELAEKWEPGSTLEKQLWTEISSELEFSSKG
jgi:hypothetical protein